jgi:hypothetical protein
LWELLELWHDWEYLYSEMINIGVERGVDADWMKNSRYTGEIKQKFANKAT